MSTDQIYFSSDNKVKIDFFSIIIEQFSEDFVEGEICSLAPEYFDDFSEIDFSSDIYSFGILFYKILTGHSLFEGKTILETIKMKLDHF